MQTSQDRLYRALETRDVRFDGRFFTGVTTTGIYCRPICPARTPRPTNCVFFACAAAAEAAGFRACRRCRPEAGPGTPAWLGTSATVSRALRMIEDGALDEDGVDELAGRLGVGGRHLRRLFSEQLGASPLAVAQTRRVHLAKRLLETTRLSMTDIAMAAGFGNVRAFNRAVRGALRASPTEIRKLSYKTGAAVPAGQIALRLPYREPFGWAGLLDFLRPRAIPHVEAIEGDTYRRTVCFGDFAGQILVRPAPGGAPALLVCTSTDAAPFIATISERARQLFDTDADPAAIVEPLARSPELAEAASAFPGTRIPGAWDRFEVAVRAILGQQVSVAGATTLAGRVVERFGRPFDGAVADDPLTHLFPRPADLAEAPLEGIGLPGARAETIRTLARAVRDGLPVLELAGDLDEAVGRLRALKGIGDWTAQYIAMRALREPDAFPAGDLGIRKALSTDGDPAPEAEVRARAAAWQPWRGYAAMLLWRTLSSKPERGTS